MESLVGYGSDDDNESERYEGSNSSDPREPAARQKEDDTNYDDVNMDLSEDSQAESEPELPPADEPPRQRHDRGNDNRGRDARVRDRDGDRRRDEHDKRERHDDRPRYERERNRERREAGAGAGRRGLLGDRPDDRHERTHADSKPFGGEASSCRSYDARDAVSPRFVDRRDKERERDRDGREAKDGRERDRDTRGDRDRRYRPDDKRSDRHRHRSRSRDRTRSRSAGRQPPDAPPAPASASASASASGDFRSTSYKVNRKLEVMEKMGLQIKTPDGSMATAQQLRRAAAEAPGHAPASASARALDQVQKRKLLWAKKPAAEAEAARWSGTRFAQDSDGRQACKFMRLMGIKDPAAVASAEAPAADPIKKQEELFQAMQQQYEVARATTHTMRGVGLGFQRGQF